MNTDILGYDNVFTALPSSEEQPDRSAHTNNAPRLFFIFFTMYPIIKF